MSATPRLTIGLPVYNGQKFIVESIEALLGQTYTDFELVISDNASTDSTGEICRGYERQDSRVRYFRQAKNIGLSPNHNYVVYQARGELFKWAAGDDLYARDLIERCVEALDEHPEVVLAHCWTARIDPAGTLLSAYEYPLNTSSRSAPERFRSMLFDSGGDDDYGVIRKDVLLRTAMKESYHHADHTIIAELALHGRFYQVPDWLYFRREHPNHSGGASMRQRCAIMDPKRADALRHPAVRLYGEYVWAYIRAIRKSPLTMAGKAACYRHLADWFASRARPGYAAPSDPVSIEPLPGIPLDAIVAGHGSSLPGGRPPVPPDPRQLAQTASVAGDPRPSREAASESSYFDNKGKM
jgi:glycosyltransferase involved in cell wall biosynthesis